MMKKLFKNFINVVLIVMLLSVYIIEPMSVAAKGKNTLGGLKEDLITLQNKKAAADASKRATEAEIRAKNDAIYKANKEIETAKIKIEEAKVEISNSNKKIEELTKKTNELMTFYQIMSGENSYLEYVTDSASMTELIMRLDAVDQLAGYNKNLLTELEELIKKNEKLEVDMTKYQNELNSNINSYNQKLATLGNDLSALVDTSLDINDEIKAQKILIDTYTKMGCKENQDLDECMLSAGNSTWFKPLNYGRITSEWGYRYSPITGRAEFHNGIDIGGNAEGTPVYSATNGTVAFILPRQRCGGNQVYIYSNVAGKRYTVYYVHLLTVNVTSGQAVTPNTVIGTVGGGRGTSGWETCSTGAHLHFGVANGYYKIDYIYYNSLISNNIKPPGFPGYGVAFYSRTQWF
ncbi:MAG: peptidoglycan DD-metalloendopeptidase family protein [Bacilli bacterium]